MRYIELFEDVDCTVRYGTFPCVPFGFTSVSGTRKTFTLNGETYNGYGQIAGGGVNVFSGMSSINANAPFASLRNRYQTKKQLYAKNGFTFGVVEVEEGNCRFMDAKIGTTNISGGQASATLADPVYGWFVQTAIGGKIYYGLMGWKKFDSTTGVALFLAEEACWQAAFRPSYNYGDQPDGTGGQGTGKIPHTEVPLTSHTGIMPSGGRGLHWYIISQSQYNDLQGYLWGEGSTIAKSLWQKFLNKTHSPVSCVCGCFSLPSVFMPAGSSVSGINIAGIQIPVSCYAFSPSFTEVTYSLGTVDAPFNSWLDYYGVLVKINVPFCGCFVTEAEKVFNKEISIKYTCDHANGNLAAIIKAGTYVLGELTGNVSYKIPVVGGDDGTLSRLGAVLVGAVGVATAGTGAAAATAIAGAAAGFAGAQYNTQIVNSDLGGSVSACTNGIAYVEYIYPNTDYPADVYADAFGLPAPYFAGTLYSFVGGYGEFQPIVSTFNCPNATEAEKDEILRLLKEGVIV